MKIYLLLILEFFKTGLFAIGGGPATIPFLSEMCDKYGWFTHEELTTMIAVSETTPGPVGVNMATYVGYTTAGFAGGLLATLALVFPSVVIICVIAKFLASFRENKLVTDAFSTIRPAVAALIATAVAGLVQDAFFRTGADGKITVLIAPVILFAVNFVLLQFKKLKKIHPVFWFAGAAVIGIVFKM
ncbi:MAG: chromate transporter [Clostridia bacterium]|nr:chromate transporter [Clostridia bacterium]